MAKVREEMYDKKDKKDSYFDVSCEGDDVA